MPHDLLFRRRQGVSRPVYLESGETGNIGARPGDCLRLCLCKYSTIEGEDVELCGEGGRIFVWVSNDSHIYLLRLN